MNFLQPGVGNSLGFTTIWSEINPCSQLGVIAKKRVTPFLREEEEELKQELDNLGLILSRLDYTNKINELKGILAKIKDIRGTIKRTTNRDNVLDDVELFEIKNLLLQTKKLKNILDDLQINKIFDTELKNHTQLIELLSIGQNKKNSFYLADEYSEKLMDIRSKKKKIDNKLLQLKKEITAEIEQLINRPVIVDEEINISKNDEGLIEKLKKDSRVNLIRENFATITFKLSPNQEILDLQKKREELKTKEEICKEKIRDRLTRKISKYKSDLLSNLGKIGYLDLLLAKAEFTDKIKGTKPEIINENKIEIVAGRHLLVERDLNKENLEFTPIDATISVGSTLITGPNMGGKTVSLKLVGLLIAMAQYGLFVPAESLRFNLRDFIYFSITSDTLESGLSTFGTEISNLKETVNVANNHGLILIDEVAHGTNPREGYAIAAAIIEKLDSMNSISLFTTHFERLATNLNVVHLQVKGLDETKLNKFKELINKQGIELLNKCMDYRLEPAKPGQEIPYDALRIAQILGFDEEILTSAQKILKENLRQRERSEINGTRDVKFR
ncbi:MutS-related protein [Sporohalobacter salinus]|uniref:lysine 5,6-aminomutase reactivase ATPase KamC n=1 Tax=Sporohalobacter salinus TaxID=1494606 RepID=UPI001960CEA8|nr:DNA mismatch repair protein MutS [Sporohalobacter salinus]MBM7622630.1 DNA mismatch repair ATPase MutS [Sporohalobacter salinus]